MLKIEAHTLLVGKLAGMAIIIVLAIALTGCTDVEGAREVLTYNGIEPTEVGGYPLFGCGEGDKFGTKFTGTTVTGRKVSGVVCRGFPKGATIRYD